jgi:hypothetical protein
LIVRAAGAGDRNDLSFEILRLLDLGPYRELKDRRIIGKIDRLQRSAHNRRGHGGAVNGELYLSRDQRRHRNIRAHDDDLHVQPFILQKTLRARQIGGKVAEVGRGDTLDHGDQLDFVLSQSASMDEAENQQQKQTGCRAPLADRF